MTLPRFGKIVPLQGDVLRLAGNVLSPDPHKDPVPKADDERIEIMQRGRTALVKRTGRDFGYDLVRWIEFLETVEELREEFTHPYAHRTTRRWLQKAIADSDRERLASLIEHAKKAP